MYKEGFMGLLRKDGCESLKNSHKSDLSNIFKLQVTKFDTW